MSKQYEVLKKNAVKWWPEDIIDLANKESVIPILLKTFTPFVGIMSSAKPNIDSVFSIIRNSKITPNLFLKHLVLLADFGGEYISRIGDHFDDIFDKDNGGKYYLEYKILSQKVKRYYFEALPCKGVGNDKLLIDKYTLEKVPSDKESPLIRDMIAIIFLGAFSTKKEISLALSQCNMMAFTSNQSRLSEYLKSHYIRVSKITSGATANNKGYALEQYLMAYIYANLPKTYSISKQRVQVGSNESIPFDMVVMNKDARFFAIEISFQVTTNSAIERKSNESSSRYRKIKNANGFIAYIVDGAGNLKRKSAIEKLIANSDGVYSINKSHLKSMVLKIKESLS